MNSILVEVVFGVWFEGKEIFEIVKWGVGWV